MPTRRAHKKSRLGCAECKRRKIKCDEVHPICWNCTRYGVLCSFDPANRARPAALYQSGISPGSIGASTPGTVDSPQNPTGWPDLLTSQGPSGYARRDILPADGHTPREAKAPDADSLGVGFPSTRDLELMHHWCVSTSDSMAFREDLRYVWRVVFPQEGYRHPFVTHGLLSLAALHKAYLIPSRRHEYLSLAASRHALGLERFISLLSNVDDSNWKAMLCYSSIVIIHVCSLAARSENGCIMAPVRSTWEFFSVVQGIKTTLSEFTGRMTRTNLAPLVHNVFRPQEEDPLMPSDDNILEQSALPADACSAFSQLSSFYEGEDLLPNREDYIKVVERMEFSSKLIASQGQDTELGLVMWWVYDISPSIMTDIQQHKPHALLLLAYYSVILSTSDRRYWFLQGWAKQLLDDVDRRLRSKDRFSEWLVWPRTHTR